MLQTQASPRSNRQTFFLILGLGILNALTPFSIDMYLPSFPAIGTAFGVSVSEVALSVSVYFIAFALGQIIYGPLLDRFGRKPPLYAGIGIYILATIGCMTAQSLNAFLVFRFLSALGGCAASVGSTAMVRDFFPPEQAPKVFSRLMLVLSVSPLLAPSAGSLVLLVTTWRTIFGILAVIALLNLLVVYLLPHGATPDKGVKLRIAPIFMSFRDIFKNKDFFTYALAGGLSFTGLFVYIAGSPSIFMDGFQVNAQVYGGIFAFLVSGMIGGGQLNLLLAKRFTAREIFRAGLTAEVVLSGLFFAGAWFNIYDLVATVIFLVLILLCVGVASPNAAALALTPFAKNAGSAAALLGFLQLGFGSVASGVVGMLKATGTVPTAVTMFGSSLLGLVILLTARRQVVIPKPL